MSEPKGHFEYEEGGWFTKPKLKWIPQKDSGSGWAFAILAILAVVVIIVLFLLSMAALNAAFLAAVYGLVKGKPGKRLVPGLIAIGGWCFLIWDISQSDGFSGGINEPNLTWFFVILNSLGLVGGIALVIESLAVYNHGLEDDEDIQYQSNKAFKTALLIGVLIIAITHLCTNNEWRYKRPEVTEQENDSPNISSASVASIPGVKSEFDFEGTCGGPGENGFYYFKGTNGSRWYVKIPDDMNIAPELLAQLKYNQSNIYQVKGFTDFSTNEKVITEIFEKNESAEIDNTAEMDNSDGNVEDLNYTESIKQEKASELIDPTVNIVAGSTANNTPPAQPKSYLMRVTVTSEDNVSVFENPDETSKVNSVLDKGQEVILYVGQPRNGFVEINQGKNEEKKFKGWIREDKLTQINKRVFE